MLTIPTKVAAAGSISLTATDGSENGAFGITIDAAAVRGDLDGDGKSDLLWRNASTQQAMLWIMNGATVTSDSVVAGPSLDWCCRASATSELDGGGAAMT